MPILVVDDDPDLQDAIVETLEQGGHRVHCVSDGRKALEYLRSGEPACLILLDLMMPGMNGWEFREEQLRDSRIASIPVVIISAHERRDTDSFANYLKKPLRAEELLAAVEPFCPPGADYA